MSQPIPRSRRSLLAGIATVPLLPLATHRAFAAGAEATPAATPSGGMRVVTDGLGNTIEVPVAPERIVVLDVNLLGLVLSLGLKPVGSSKYGTAESFPEVLAGQVDGIEVLGKNESLDIEAVVNLKPDLILMTWYGDPTTYDLVKHIAPTVRAGEFRDDWRADSVIVADAVNRRAEMEAISRAYDQRVAGIREDLPAEFRETPTAVIRFRSDDIRLLNANAFASNVLKDITFTAPDPDAESTGIASDLSLERIRDLDFPTLWVVSDGNADADGNLAEAIASPLFQTLQAVQAGHIYFVNQEWWITLRGYFAAGLILDDVQRYLIEGEPSPTIPGTDG